MRNMQKGFTIVELLIVMAVIAAIISALVPVGVNAIRHARATTIAIDLSQISKAVMSDFYLNHDSTPTLKKVESYFPQAEAQILKMYNMKILNSTLTKICIWYVPTDITASEVQKIYPAVEASGTHPMMCVEMEKYW